MNRKDFDFKAASPSMVAEKMNAMWEGTKTIYSDLAKYESNHIVNELSGNSS